MQGSSWEVCLHDEFEAEFASLERQVRLGLLAAADAIATAGPAAGRPHVDTLKGSRYANMKELRFNSMDGRQVWRAAFAFDPNRAAVILVAAAKQGASQRRFYERLITVADRRFEQHLAKLVFSRQ